jgi:hypothetical protein
MLMYHVTGSSKLRRDTSQHIDVTWSSDQNVDAIGLSKLRQNTDQTIDKAVCQYNLLLN